MKFRKYFKTYDLYFRGTNNTLTIIEDLIQTKQLMKAKSVILSGGSAGGVVK